MASNEITYTYEVNAPKIFVVMAGIVSVFTVILTAAIVSIAIFIKPIDAPVNHPAVKTECRCHDFEARLKSVEDDVDNLLDMVE